MKKLIYFVLSMTLPVLSFADNTDFSYDKNALSNEFDQLNKVEVYVDQTNTSYSDLVMSHKFEGNFELTNSIALSPNLNISDVDWGSFAWGFCCWPVGIFTVLINDDKDQNSKNSFWAGIGTAAISYSLLYVGVYVALIASLGAGF